MFALAAGAVLSFDNLNADGAAKVVEMYAVLNGTLLLTPLFTPEADREIWELEKSKAMSMWQLYAGRILVALLLLLIAVGTFVLRMHLGKSVFDAAELWCSGFAEAFFLGSIGYFTAAVTNQAVLGYMASLLYFIANIGAADKLGVFGLYPLLRGEKNTWPWLLASAVILTVSAVLLRERKH